MITPADLEFHHDDTSDYTWAETYFLPISVPEAGLFAFAYVCARPVLGVMGSCVREETRRRGRRWTDKPPAITT